MRHPGRAGAVAKTPEPGITCLGARAAGQRTRVTDSDIDPDGPAGPQPSRVDKRWYFALMAICIALFVLSWAVIDRYSVLAAVIVSVVALVIPPVAVIVANVASATDRRHP